ncbi:MAG: L,D-transpeptidase [Minicystis sp.]
MKKALSLLAALTCLATSTVSRSGEQDPITEIRIDKSDHRLDLVSEGRVVKTYRIAIGPGGAGHKRMEGDKVTPVGTYRIVGQIKGLFHQFLTVSYPNDEDRTRFAELKHRGKIPRDATIGGGIGIHGVNGKQWKGVHKENDWTLGCIALDDDEIDEIAARVKTGTTVVITD